MSWCKTFISFVLVFVTGFFIYTKIEAKMIDAKVDEILILKQVADANYELLSKNYVQAKNVFLKLYHQTKDTDFLVQALEALELGNEPLQFRELLAQIKNDESNSDLLFLKASGLAKNGEFEEAKKLAQVLVKRNYVQSFILLASLEADAGLEDEAFSHLLISYEKFKDEASLGFMFELLLKDNERLRVEPNANISKKNHDAYYSILKNLNIDDSCELHMCLNAAYSHFVEKDFTKSLIYYQKAYEQAPYDGVKQMLFLLYMQDKNYLESLKTAQDLDAKMAVLELAKRDGNKELDLVQEALKSDNSSDLKLLQATLLLEKDGKKYAKEARDLYNKHAYSNLSASYLNRLAYGFALAKSELDLAIELLHQALSKNEKDIYFLDSLAWAHYQNKDCKKAFEIFTQIESIEPNVYSPQIDETGEFILHKEQILKCK